MASTFSDTNMWTWQFAILTAILTAHKIINSKYHYNFNKLIFLYLKTRCCNYYT